MPYQRKTDDEINELAKRLYRNELFVSWMLDHPSMLPRVFMVLAFVDEEAQQDIISNDIQYFYEEYSAAMPMSVNGYPCFTSAHYLSREDGMRVSDRLQQILEIMRDV